MVQQKTQEAPAIATISTNTLMEKVSEKYKDIPKKIIKDILHQLLNAIEVGVASGDKVRLNKLGILQIKDRAARMGRNPKTGEKMNIPANKKISFRVASSLKERIGIQRKKTNPKASRASVTKKKK